MAAVRVVLPWLCAGDGQRAFPGQEREKSEETVAPYSTCPIVLQIQGPSVSDMSRYVSTLGPRACLPDVHVRQLALELATGLGSIVANRSNCASSSATSVIVQLTWYGQTRVTHGCGRGRWREGTRCEERLPAWGPQPDERPPRLRERTLS